ncbi:MAG: HAMP domain-containing sensor histidine kinase [Caulobacteraceae bacterium]
MTWPGGLSARLLLLTALFALAAGLLILIPSLAAFQETRYLDRLRAAELASLAVEAAPARTVSQDMAAQLLNGAGVVSVAVQSGGVRRLLLEAPRMRRTPELVDLRQRNPASWIAQPFITLFASDDRSVRVVARPRFRDGDFVEVVIPEAPLRKEILGYLLGLVWVAGFIAAVAGASLYLALNFFLVRPVQKITVAMERFRADPDDPGARVVPSGRRDEIGRAEAELDRMQADLRAALASRARLAALGEAVAKINHDLRNMLSSARLASERLAAGGDPRASPALPRLERALDRAITLASDVLSYGKSREAAPQAAPVRLLAALQAASEDAGLSDGGVRLATEITVEDEVLADPDQLHRILVNLLRNAREAIEAGAPDRQGRVSAALERRGGDALVRLSDNGPGVPERMIPLLFQPFSGSGRQGGAGLGLAISRELAQAHGGELLLVRTGPEGSTFELRLPATAPTAAQRAEPAALGPMPAEIRSSGPRPRGEGPPRPRGRSRVS